MLKNPHDTWSHRCNGIWFQIRKMFETVDGARYDPIYATYLKESDKLVHVQTTTAAKLKVAACKIRGILYVFFVGWQGMSTDVKRSNQDVGFINK